MIDLLTGFMGMPYVAPNMDFNTGGATYVEQLGQIAASVNACIQQVNDNTDAVGQQSEQIQTNNQTMIDREAAYEAILDAFKNSIAVPVFQTLGLLHGWLQAWPAIHIQAWKDATGTVHLRGKLLIGTTTPGTTIAQLPVGYRPGQGVILNPCTDATTCVIEIGTDGFITASSITGGTYVSLDGISFSVII
jgi:hypothetical protein